MADRGWSFGETSLAQATYAAWLEGRAWCRDEELLKVWRASKARAFLAQAVSATVLERVDADISGTIPVFPPLGGTIAGFPAGIDPWGRAVTP